MSEFHNFDNYFNPNYYKSGKKALTIEQALKKAGNKNAFQI
jgi:hypothetical protein